MQLQHSHQQLFFPKDADKDLTVKVDFAQIGTGFTGVQGDLIAIDADTNGTNTQGTGVGSGSTIDATGSTAVSGIRLFKSFSTFAAGSIGSTGVADGSLCASRLLQTQTVELVLTNSSLLLQLNISISNKH